MAADTYRWRGGTTSHLTHWDEPANWVNAAGNAHSTTYPGKNEDGDIVLFDAAVTYGVIGFTVVYQLASLAVTREFNKSIGSTGAPVILDCTGAVRIEAYAATEIWLNGGGAGAKTGLNGVTITESTNTTTLGGEINSLTAMKGDIHVANSATIVANLTITYAVSITTDYPYVQIGTGCTLPASINQNTGELSCGTTIPSLILNGGRVNITTTVTDLKMYDGLAMWTAGTITNAEVYGGKLDASTSDTIRTCTLLKIFANGQVDLNNGSNTAKFTSCTFYNGKLTTTPGASLVIS